MPQIKSVMSAHLFYFSSWTVFTKFYFSFPTTSNLQKSCWFLSQTTYILACLVTFFVTVRGSVKNFVLKIALLPFGCTSLAMRAISSIHITDIAMAFRSFLFFEELNDTQSLSGLKRIRRWTILTYCFDYAASFHSFQIESAIVFFFSENLHSNCNCL